MSDRLALAHAIEEAGIPRAGAEGMATAIARFVEGSVATKADVEHVEATLKAESAAIRTELKAEIASVRTDLVTLRAATRADIDRLEAALHADLRSEGVRLDRRLDLVSYRLLLSLGSLMVVLTGLLVGVLHAWPPK